MIKGKWYHIEINQKYVFDKENYVTFIQINQQAVMEIENEHPIEFHNLDVFVSHPWEHAADQSKIRNFKFQTEQDDFTGWQVIDGTDCWLECGNKAGSCDHCGANGFCCSKSKHDINGDCTSDMVEAIYNSPWVGLNVLSAV